ncbi:hypothetical protein VE03_01776 [Pseudogymnoascus sp. 23342-1-I1]|nr:hypothetical protein VE03_01776 [Pseudogymnoascus sp. 23342-1-I1]
MATVSTRTVRVLEIPKEVDESEFLAVARSLSSKDVEGGWLSKVQHGDANPVISFATQYDGHVGTISLPSEKHKVRALDHHATYWRFDDKFNGVTVLVSPLDADVDICAVHGLNGNAFQTWTAKANGKMWLRDLLPYSKPFDNARIMTFGYSSQISDRANLSGTSEWAHHLLESMARVRRSQKNPWRPPAIALNCFQPEGKTFFEGRGLNQRSKIKGRHLELKSLRQIVEQLQDTEKSSIAITGIGGIGKTATLLEIAHQESEQRNIFFIHATDAASLHQAYLHIAKCIGPEYLLKEFRGRDVQAIWSSESEEDKVRRFKTWLNDPENIGSLFLLDDMDGIQELEDREAAFPDEAKIILYTTRNPVFHRNNIRTTKKLRLSMMETEDIITLMEDIRNETPEYQSTADLYNRDILLEIVNVVRCHPLAALNAIKYILRILSFYEEATAGSKFVAMMAANNYKARQHFLAYKPDSPSIMETFEVSQIRLSKPDTQARALMNFLSLIETEWEGDEDFRDFFFEHLCPVLPENFLDHQLLGAESFHLQELFSELEKVSFGERLQTSRPFQFHPLWLECTRHTMGPEGRIRYARQVLLISYHTICVNHGVVNITPDTDDSFLRHVCKCLQVCRSFQIGLDDLKLPTKVSKFFKAVECAN